MNPILRCTFIVTFIFSLFPQTLRAQINEDQLGAWYMYFWNTTIKDGPVGFQGDIQHRNWDLLGDLQQLMLRGGITLKPKDANIKFTLGYANITTGAFGSDNDDTFSESRIYQEALIPQKVGKRFLLTHRFRFEQRFIDTQDTRTRWRYAIFVNVPFKGETLNKGTLYFAFYNETFLNGERNIGNNRSVDIFGVNRTYGALGYSLSNNIRMQAGYMQQVVGVTSKGQLQLSLHHKI